MAEENEGGTPDGSEIAEQLTKLKERGFETIDDLLADRDKTAEERDHFKEHNAKAQKIIQRQGSELGDLRKGTPSKITEDSETGGNSGSSGSEITLAELEATLTEEQKAAAEQAFQNATPEEKEAFVANPETRKKLLIEAKRSVRSVPSSLFGSTSNGDPAASASADEQRIKELFNAEKNRSTFYPSGSGGGTVPATGDKGDDDEVTYARPVGTGGVLNRINRDRQTA